MLARQQVRRLTQELKFSLVDQTKMVTAASELARNALHLRRRRHHALGNPRRRRSRSGLKLLFADEGPGIPELDLAMTDGWTSGKGLGMGLTGREAAGQ